MYFKKKINLKKIKLPVNQWIFNEFIETQNLVTNNIDNFRFDEASRHAYKFVWHSYCDWYLEFLKPIFNSKNKTEVDEARNFSVFMLTNLLRMLHPFIPFFTESVWTQNKYNNFFNTSLVNAHWPNYKNQSNFDTNKVNINNLIELITDIRSTKAELNIKPKLFCDIIFFEKSKKLKPLISRNIDIIKQVGRVNNLFQQKNLNKNSIEILVLKEKLALQFNEGIDIMSQKNRILQKLEHIEAQKNKLNIKLKNKAYLKNAPKEIVQNDRDLLKDLMIEDSKLRSIVSSIN